MVGATLCLRLFLMTPISRPITCISVPQGQCFMEHSWRYGGILGVFNRESELDLPLEATWPHSLELISMGFLLRGNLNLHWKSPSLWISWCLTLCSPTDCGMPGFPVLHCLPEFAQVHVHSVGDAIQPSHPLSPSSPFALNLSQHQGLELGLF